MTGLNNDVRDLNSDNDIFVYAYSASTRTVEIRVADGLNFRLKIPTDEELRIMLIILGMSMTHHMTIETQFQ